ncbi:signal peptidase I [Deinococcus cellulosilyticus]|uniref:signal peptidase I n=1 Tax=Deinococcus cellulosilyticus TaxID=401558 RepID=UPI001FE8E187|nr:signal peptidase I [Deinococcus cellulosilyticus]
MLKRFLKEWVLLTFLPLYLLLTFVVTFGTVSGDSMAPTLHEGERVLVLKYARWFSAWGLSRSFPQYGQLLVLKAPEGSEYSIEKGWFGIEYRPYMVKRLIGKPGDRIELREGEVYLNGEKIPEPYIKTARGADSMPEVTLKSDEYFVLGDNRSTGSSVDSRYYGPVKFRDLAGPVVPLF